ncbi:syntaxin 1B/2/3 [Nematocida displodere]|uniref:Syntaxin 1B/2/3 n=1 Tax=Nematocida displodere TaxID=1805483 RepID=A0A177EE71_9MICR|nr:syntaxin 1B/2/3 [Nematocida displodere]
MKVEQPTKDILESIQHINMRADDANVLLCELSSLKNQHMLAHEETKPELTRSIETISKDFQALLSSILNDVHQLQQGIGAPASSNGAYMFSTHIAALTQRAQKILEAFKNEELAIYERESARQKDLYRIAKPEATDEELERLHTAVEGKALIQAAYSLGAKSEHSIIRAAEERHETILSVSEDLARLNTIAEELSQIIAMGSTSIDSLTYNTHAMKDSTITANQHLQKGVNYQKRKKKFILFVWAIAAIVLLGLTLGILQYLRKLFPLF